MDEKIQGIGGKDAWIMNIAYDMHTFGQVCVYTSPQGIHIKRGDEDAITFGQDNFRELVEWLQSWGYI